LVPRSAFIVWARGRIAGSTLSTVPRTAFGDAMPRSNSRIMVCIAERPRAPSGSSAVSSSTWSLVRLRGMKASRIAARWATRC